MAGSDDQVINSISSSMLDMEKSMQRLMARSETLANALDRNLKKIGTSAKKAGSDVAVGTSAMDKGMKASQQSATQLTYQLNDIGTSLAGGASPFMVMAQQGSQVAQVFQQLKAQGGSAGSALSASLGMVINPMSLLVNALILGTGYAASFFGEWISGAEDSEDAMKKLIDTANELRQSQGLKPIDISSSDAALFKRQRDTTKAYGDAVVEVAGQLATVKKTLLGMPATAFEGQTKTVNDFDSALSLLEKQLAAGNPDFLAFAETMKLIAANDKVPKVIRDLADQLIDAAANGALTREQMQAISDTLDGTAAKVEAFTKAMAELAKIAPPTLSDMEKITLNYATAIRNATTVQERFNATLEATQAIARVMGGVYDNVIGTISDKVTGLTETLAKGHESAIALIKEREGFRPDAYMDSGSWRVGFGSDTFVDEMGRVQKVTKDTVVTLAQANADLKRRVAEFQDTIRSQIGGETWASLSEQQQAALSSIAYNYGSLPDAIVKAIKTGDSGKVADAIRGLAGDNGGINAERRKQEAAIYGGAEAAKAQVQSFDALYAANAKALELTKRQTAINKDANLTLDQKTVATRAAAEEQKLLSAAEQQGLTVTPELTAKIKEQALAMAEAGLAADQAANKTSQLNQTQQQTAQALSQLEASIGSGLSTFIDDLRHGEDAGEAFRRMIDSLISDMIRMTVQALIMKPIFDALRGAWGLPVAGAAGAPAAKQGGTVGFGNLGKRAGIGGPSYMTGGMVGHDPNAFPITAHRGEVIVPTSVLRKAAGQTRGAQGDTIHIDGRSTVKIDVSNGGGTSATTASTIEFGQLIDRTIQGVLVRESKPGGLLRQQPGAR